MKGSVATASVWLVLLRSWIDFVRTLADPRWRLSLAFCGTYVSMIRSEKDYSDVTLSTWLAFSRLVDGCVAIDFSVSVSTCAKPWKKENDVST